MFELTHESIIDDELVSKSWSKDERAAAAAMTTDQARWAVDYYYTVQNWRIRAANQKRATDASAESNICIEKMFGATTTLELRIQQALAQFAKAQKVGPWLTAVCGIGPVISAGLLAHIDIAKCRYPANLWSFAGVNPSASWLGAEGAKKLFAECETGDLEETMVRMAAAARRNPCSIQAQLRDDETGEVKLTKDALIKVFALRPWNARLKVLCWKAGQSFVKVSGNANGFYGHIWLQRKAFEVAKNEAGTNAEQAAAVLVDKKIGKGTDAYAAYSTGKLPPAHVQARAERYAVKMFLSHLHTVWTFTETGRLPAKPYATEHYEGHSHIIVPPHTDAIAGLTEALEEWN